MPVQTYTLAGEECRVHFPTSLDEARGFLDWVCKQPIVAVDTETTGLDIWGRAFNLRLVQFGSATDAWVLRADLFGDAIRAALAGSPRLAMHNAAYDCLVLDRWKLAGLDDMLAKTIDTYILAHLLDPRGIMDGGIGHALKDLAAFHVDPAAPDQQAGLAALFKEMGLTKDTGWAGVPIDHPTYVLYAGLDVLLTMRLLGVVLPEARTRGLDKLVRFEHAVQGATARMMRRGMAVDVDYTERLVTQLAEEKTTRSATALTFGVKNVNSTQQVAKALTEMGEEMTESTPSGKDKVDHDVLLKLMDLGGDMERVGAREPNPLAEAVFYAKRASKWSSSYAEAMLANLDTQSHIHPDIRSLQARTARMSISSPPLQQLPANDGTIRRCLVPDHGFALGGVDYKNIEMRVLAALANEPTMKKAIAAGEDLHDTTATLLYGPGFTSGQRKLAKVTGFAKVYGGGATTIARQVGAPIESVKVAIARYDEVYPAIKRYSRKLQTIAELDYTVTTPAGRPLPVDEHRLYSATNYVVQSTARDILAQALLDLEKAGLGEHLLLPVHDEVIFQARKSDAEDVMAAIRDAMASDFYGVQIETSGKVYGPSWGHGYGAE